MSVKGVKSREKMESASYQMRNVSKKISTQRKDNRPEESGSIEWNEFKKPFLRKYFPCEMTEVKVEEFSNLNQHNMSVEEYSLKLSMLPKYAPSLVSNPRDEMIRFVMGVAD